LGDPFQSTPERQHFTSHVLIVLQVTAAGQNARGPLQRYGSNAWLRVRLSGSLQVPDGAKGASLPPEPQVSANIGQSWKTAVDPPTPAGPDDLGPMVPPSRQAEGEARSAGDRCRLVTSQNLEPSDG
jgi:hypothetical protein